MDRAILIVDDSESIRAELLEAFAYLGYETLQAENGQQALDLIKTKGENIHLMLCDVNMPVMNGLELLDNLKKQGLLKFPALMVTTETNPRQVKQALMAGAKGWVLKPYRIESVMIAVEGLLEKFSPDIKK